MAVELFKCSFCGKNKRLEYLAQVLDESGALGNIKNQITYTEKLRTEAYTEYLKESDEEKRGVIQLNIKDFEFELRKLYDEVKQSKKPVCSLCVKQGRERSQPTTFVCDLCGEEKQGEGTKLHVDDWQEEGIYPTVLHTFCRMCIGKHALSPPPNWHCPLISYGRDDYSMEKQRFDCNCQVKGITY